MRPLMRAPSVERVSTNYGRSYRIHGVPRLSYLFRVTLPLLRQALGVAALLIAVLSAADITTVLLLHPPGHSSLPLAIFTIMANSPEGLVASLCILYGGVVFAGLTASALLLRRKTPATAAL